MKKLMVLALACVSSMAFASVPERQKPAAQAEQCYQTSVAVKRVFILRQETPEKTEVQSNASFYAYVKSDPELSLYSDPLIDLFKGLNSIVYRYNVNENPESVGANVFAACVE